MTSSDLRLGHYHKQHPKVTSLGVSIIEKQLQPLPAVLHPTWVCAHILVDLLWIHLLANSLGKAAEADSGVPYMWEIQLMFLFSA